MVINMTLWSQMKMIFVETLPFWANGKDAALDISVVNPLQQELVRKVNRDGGSGVQHSFKIKMGKYSDRCEAESIVFIPLIVDTYGEWHKDSLEVEWSFCWLEIM